MVRAIRTFTLALAMLGVAGMAGAQSKPAQTRQPATQNSTAKKAAPALVASGRITSFDAKTNTLVVSTSHGAEKFVLARPYPHVENGKSAATVDQLASLSGREVRVSYLENGGTRTVQMIHVESPAPLKASK
jgi:hypothetical protein